MKRRTMTQSAIDLAYDLYVAASEVTQPLPWDLIFRGGKDNDLVPWQSGLEVRGLVHCYDTGHCTPSGGGRTREP